MKRILIFTGLKIAELVVAPGILLIAGYNLIQRLDKFELFHYLNNGSSVYFKSFLGALFILFCFCIGWIFGIIIYHLIETNWRKAGELEKKWTRK
jgi:hypothetical protein